MMLWFVLFEMFPVYFLLNYKIPNIELKVCQTLHANVEWSFLMDVVEEIALLRQLLTEKNLQVLTKMF